MAQGNDLQLITPVVLSGGGGTNSPGVNTQAWSGSAVISNYIFTDSSGILHIQNSTPVDIWTLTKNGVVYPIYDVLTLSPWQFYDNSGTTTQIGTTIWRGLGLADNNIMTCTIPAPFNWNNGNITGITIFWAASAAATGTVVFDVNVFSDAPGTTITSGGTQANTIASTAYTAAETVKTSITLSPVTAHTLGNSLRINVERGTDTYTGVVIVTGIQIIYQA